MIQVVLEIDDHPDWAECTKEAVAERLCPLGKVRVVEVTVDKPQQLGMFETPPPPTPKNTCPKCGSTRVIPVKGPEGGVVLREIIPRTFWPSLSGPEWAMDTEGNWQLGYLDGDKDNEHIVGWPIHRCGT